MIFGTGVDICDISRVEALLAHYGMRFVRRVLTPAEIAVQGKVDPRFLARRFAAKEAVAKALGAGIGGKVGFQDIEIVRHEGEAPKVVLSPEACARLANDIGVHVSISDEKTHAVAMAVAEQNCFP